MRRVLTLGVVLLALGCGGGEGPEQEDPNAPFPAVAGHYLIHGTFDQYPQTDASFSGFLSFSQASLTEPELTGSVAITATLDGVIYQFQGALTSGTISKRGGLSMTLMTPAGATWGFTGEISGGQGSGRHVLGSGSTSFPGNWSMTTRPGAALN